MLYMICASAGSPATARSNQSRKARASSMYPPIMKALSVRLASRNQQNR